MNDYEIYRMAEKKVRMKLALEIHLIVFSSIMAILFVINILFTPLFLWVIIVLCSWGLGFTIHSLTYFIKQGRNLALLINISSTLIVETMLIYINLVFQPTYFWFLFPLIPFSIGLTLHGIYHVRSLKEKEEEEKNWYLKRIEKEAARIKHKITEEE